MALSTVVNESGFQGGLYAGDLTFVDIGFFLLAGAIFDIQVIQPLAVDQCNAQLFGLGCIDEHSLHAIVFSLRCAKVRRH